MLTSKERSELRAQANSIETTLIVGKEGVTETVIAEAENQLTARELIKGKVLETALMSAREVSLQRKAPGRAESDRPGKAETHPGF